MDRKSIEQWALCLEETIYRNCGEFAPDEDKIAMAKDIIKKSVMWDYLGADMAAIAEDMNCHYTCTAIEEILKEK